MNRGCLLIEAAPYCCLKTPIKNRANFRTDALLCERHLVLADPLARLGVSDLSAFRGITVTHS